jgi:Ca2+-binding RTX toxin-like protein
LLDQPLDWLRSLTVTGLDNRTDSLTVDPVASGGFALPDGVLFDGGAGRGSDKLTLRGSAGADRFVLDTPSAAAVGLDVRYLDVEQLTLDGGKGDDTYEVSDLSTRTTISDSGGTDLLDFSHATVGVGVNLASSSPQQVFGPTNPNTLSLKGTLNHVTGSPLADVIRGNSAANRIEGQGSNDSLYGSSGNDSLYGGLGNDALYGNSGNDWLYGGDGRDSLYGHSGNDVLLGGDGDDFLDSGTGRNLLIGGVGSDNLRGSSGEEILIGGTTAYDTSDAAMAAVMTEWTSTRRSFRQRTERLDAGIAHPTLGWIQLRRSLAPGDGLTVLDDGARDVLFGGSGSDWFLDFTLPDEVQDRGPKDR